KLLFTSSGYSAGTQWPAPGTIIQPCRLGMSARIVSRFIPGNFSTRSFSPARNSAGCKIFFPLQLWRHLHVTVKVAIPVQAPTEAALLILCHIIVEVLLRHAPG